MSIYQQVLLQLLREKKLKEYDVVNLSFAHYKYKHNQKQDIHHNIAPTLITKCNFVVAINGGDNIDKLDIRRLTPREYWRLMGFSDEDFNKVDGVLSDTQLYKQAGNSIVVNVLEEILKNLLIEKFSNNKF